MNRESALSKESRHFTVIVENPENNNNRNSVQELARIKDVEDSDIYSDSLGLTDEDRKKHSNVFAFAASFEESNSVDKPIQGSANKSNS